MARARWPPINATSVREISACRKKAQPIKRTDSGTIAIASSAATTSRPMALSMHRRPHSAPSSEAWAGIGETDSEINAI